MTYYLNEKDIRDICYEYAKNNLTHDEPIPEFDRRYPGKLESVLAIPQTQIAGCRIYAELSGQASVLFYEMIKQHPLVNGNKRTACVALLVFLALNDNWIYIEWLDLYRLAVNVAKSETSGRAGILESLTEFLKRNIVEVKQ